MGDSVKYPIDVKLVKSESEHKGILSPLSANPNNYDSENSDSQSESSVSDGAESPTNNKGSSPVQIASYLAAVEPTDQI